MVAIKGLGKKYAQQEHNLFSWKYVDLPKFLEILDLYLSTCAKKVEDLKVLDLGCGSGKIFEYLIKKGFKEENIYGIDVDETFLQEAKNDFPSSHIFLGDVKNFTTIKELKAEKFDLCISVHVLHFFVTEELISIFQQISTSLVQDGCMLAITAHPMRWINNRKYSYFAPQSRNILTPWGTQLTIQQHTFSDYLHSLRKAEMYIENIWEPTPLEQGRVEPANFYKYSVIPTRLMFLARKYA